jgi:carboxyl-terminal processing protease
VLDLRDNPGGLLDEAVGVVSRFVDKGAVLIERDRSGHQTPVNVNHDKPVTNLPLAVVINGGTASAAEVVTAALLYHNRATAVGEHTFGTATVLQTFGLPDGSAILLGGREWLTPAGQPLRNVGVQPTDTVALQAPDQALTPSAPSSRPEEACASADTQLKAAASRVGLACTAG